MDMATHKQSINSWHSKLDLRNVLPALSLKQLDSDRLAFIIKWVASIIQILGYAATAVGMTPLNIYLFLFGLTGWLAVGIFWKDRAIILIHCIALGSMIIGLAS